MVYLNSYGNLIIEYIFMFILYVCVDVIIVFEVASRCEVEQNVQCMSIQIDI